MNDDVKEAAKKALKERGPIEDYNPISRLCNHCCGGGDAKLKTTKFSLPNTNLILAKSN